MLQGELISHKLVETFHEPQVNNIDYVVKAPIAKGHGFMYEPHPKKSVRIEYCQFFGEFQKVGA
jgi:hypothetical protein